MDKDHGTIIGVVSGKGGTGKTLLTAVLGRALSREGFRVLLVDLDTYVRGLSILLSSYINRSSRTPKLSITELMEYSLHSKSGDFKEVLQQRDENRDIVFPRFFECDLLPATRDIGDPFDYEMEIFPERMMRHPGEFQSHFVEQLFGFVRNRYDYILLDCRAGIDIQVVLIARSADYIISVAEDDDVCLQANTNLINHLRYRHESKNVFSLINKGRRITSYDELKDIPSKRSEFNFMGVIPFDIEVMQDFGKERFWSTINQTLYFRALIDAWNYFAERTGVDKLSIDKYHFPPTIFMSRKSGRLTLIERAMRVYGVMFSVGGIGIFLYGYASKYLQTPLSSIDLMAFVSLIIGAISLIVSSSNFRKWMLGSSDTPGSK